MNKISKYIFLKLSLQDDFQIITFVIFMWITISRQLYLIYGFWRFKILLSIKHSIHSLPVVQQMQLSCTQVNNVAVSILLAVFGAVAMLLLLIVNYRLCCSDFEDDDEVWLIWSYKFVCNFSKSYCHFYKWYCKFYLLRHRSVIARFKF